MLAKLRERFDLLTIGRLLTLKSGATMVVETSATASSTLTPTELATVDVTPGTVTASKALVLDSSGNLSSGVVGFTGAKLSTEAGAGITGGTGTVYKTSVSRVGGIVTTKILIDLTGLASSTTDLDIIGQGVAAAHIGQITAARNGTNLTFKMECLEVPAGGVADIDVYLATEGTGVFDAAISTLTETAVITSGGAWTLALTRAAIAGVEITADSYLYLCGGAGGTAATYTAGKFLITMEGYI